MIASTVAGEFNLDGVELIQYNLWCDNAVNLKRISSNTLSMIGASMILRNLTTLETISFPKLGVSTGIYWWSLLALDKIEFGRSTDQYTEGPFELEAQQYTLSVQIGKSFMSNLDALLPAGLRVLDLFHNPRIRSLNFGTLQSIGNVSIVGNESLRSLRLGNSSEAGFVNLNGNFTV